MELTLKTILSSDAHSVRSNSYYNIDDKYLLGDRGILLDRNGELLWQEQWQHSVLSRMLYIRNPHILITDRLAMPGPFTMSLGLCAIDMNNGKYLWKHWYEDSYEERMALRQDSENVKKDIRLLSLNHCFICGDYILTGGFKINLITGDYETLQKEADLEGVRNTEEPIIPVGVIHDTVSYRGPIKTFALSEEASMIWGEKFPWYQRVMNEVLEQKILSEIKIYDIVESLDNNLLIAGKDMKLRKDAVFLLTITESLQ